jgi:hypothetical protein
MFRTFINARIHRTMLTQCERHDQGSLVYLRAAHSGIRPWDGPQAGH